MSLRSWSLVVMLSGACAIGSALALEPEPLMPGQVLRGQFTQERVLEGFSAPLKTIGDFVLAPGQGLIWQAKKPFAVTTVMTAAGISQRNGSVEMLNLPSSRAPFLAQLYGILGGALAGDPHLLEQHFRIVQNKDEKGWNLVLTPRAGEGGATVAIREIRIEGRRFVDQVIIRKDSGDRDQLTFGGQSLSNAPLSAEEARLLADAGQ